ncbi:hypothetical protein PoB_000893200 [Plakobranchus ocellatus]|uniref:WSC domain-containing protein n=1 Tax=Plakobranchus ocellatus TaxID=259542 RepID=A0AAV3YHV9_9GAST|nr:hypothetical protein PoB_000893200 [Plakobranchus ocellatus]
MAFQRSSCKRNSNTRVLLCFCILLYTFMPCVETGERQLDGGDSSWYEGCFRRNNEPAQKEITIAQNIADCSRKCDSKGFHYIAVRRNSCLCEKDVSQYESVSLYLCEDRCKDVPDDNLPCGGHKTKSWSVYWAAGPWVERVDAKAIARWVEPGHSTTLRATVSLRDFVDIDLEPYIESEWSNTIELTWRPGFSSSSPQSMNISANNSQEVAVCALTFPKPGLFPIGE